MSPEDGRGKAQAQPEPVVTREIAAEAAVWIARLHGPDRSHLMERECRAWQARSAAHRLAFERGTDLWLDAAGVDRAVVARTAEAYAATPATSASAASAAVSANVGTTGAPREVSRAWRFKPQAWAVAMAAIVLAGVLGFGFWPDGDRYDTGVGEQRVVMLRDGTRISLNTSTRVRVVLGATRRTVSVEGGEALFEVAKDASRPFVVRAAGSEVTATGTAFVVRYTPTIAGNLDALDITLVEGRVVVRGPTGGASAAFIPAVEMAPGERLRVAGSRGAVGAAVKPKMDRPRVDQVLAWKRGEAIFDNASLPEAVAEMNRYSSVPISVVGVGLRGDLRISGVFKAGDNLSFARAVASLHGLAVLERADGLELAPRSVRRQPFGKAMPWRIGGDVDRRGPASSVE